MSKHQLTDRAKWVPWAFVCNDDSVHSREYVISNHPPIDVIASGNATVVLERMVRRGRVEWYDKQKRAAIRRQFKRGGA